jgi:uncharacterized membrane protein YphA (DoxX/SURF4 family)
MIGLRLAHETWFTERRPGYSWDFLTQPETLAVIAVAVVVALVWRALGRRLPSPELPWLHPLGLLGPWIPRLLGIHAGVSLLSQASRGTYLAPSLQLPDGFFGTVLAIVEAATGIWLIAGYRIRPAAWLLAVSGPLGMLGYGVVPLLERVDLLGIALFLVILPPDDSRPGGRVRPEPRRLTAALLGLRLLVGSALVVLAFTEKLARPELARAFLDRYPAFNILQAVGFEASDAAFIRIAGGVELLFGLLIISGALPQVAVIVAGIPFNATLFFLGTSELIGHLPVYGAMLVLIVYGSDPSTARLVSWLPGAGAPEAGTSPRGSGAAIEEPSG